MGWKMFSDRGIKLTVKEYFRPAVQYMNALGGGILLDMLDTEEIRDVFVEYISQIYNKDKTQAIFIKTEDAYDVIEDDEENAEYNAEYNEDIAFMQEENGKEEIIEKTIDEFGAGIQSVGIKQDKDEKETQMLNKTMGKPKAITFGCSVILYVVEDDRCVRYDVPKEKGVQGWYEIFNHMMGKSIGESFKLKRCTYTVKDISW